MKPVLILMIIAVFAALCLSCGETKPTTEQIRPRLKEFLTCVARQDYAGAQAYLSEGFRQWGGSPVQLAEFFAKYKAYLAPCLFAFDAPQPEGDGYLVRVYLYKDRRQKQEVTYYVIYEHGGWKVANCLIYGYIEGKEKF